MVAILEREFFVGEILGRRVYLKAERIGRLGDVVIREVGPIPEVSHFVVTRSFGYPSLLVPWDRVALISNTEIVVEIAALADYEQPPPPGAILLKDHILDKKILDMDDHEVEVVYDVKLTFQNGKLFASEVDFSRSRLLRRLGLKKFAHFLAESRHQETVSWLYVQRLPEDLGAFTGHVKLKVLKEHIHEIHPVDLADVLEELDPNQRVALFSQLDAGHASDTLEEVEPRVQRELITGMKKERAALLINQMSPGQAADILAILPAAESEEILGLMSRDSAPKVQKILEQHDENVMLFATQQFIRMRPETPVSDVMTNFRELARNMEVINYVYVTDADNVLRGVADLRELIAAEPQQTLGEIMTEPVIGLSSDRNLSDAVDMLERYGFRAIPVVDPDERLLGVISLRDIRGIKPRLE
jgi:CBS domain-containing protein